MSVTIRSLGVEAAVDRGRWTGDAMLVRYAEVISGTVEPTGATPSVDGLMAQAVIDLLGGEIIASSEPDAEPGRVY